jgi:PAS domain S-box-containing protein
MSIDHVDEAITQLQGCIDHLGGVVALSVISGGGEPSHVVGTLLDALVTELRLDFAYVQLKPRTGEAALEVVRVADSYATIATPSDIATLLARSLGPAPESWAPTARIDVGGEGLALAVLRMGLQRQVGTVVAGCRRSDFPRSTESVVLRGAAGHAALGLYEARQLGERERAADLQRPTAERSVSTEALQQEVFELRRAEENLRAIEINHAGFIESFPGLVVTMSLAGQIQLLNKEVLDYFGKTREELRDWGRTDAVHPDDLPRVAAAFADAVATGSPYSIEHRCRRADGVYRWFQVRALPVRDGAGAVTGWYVVLTDIDDLKRAEEAIRATERGLRNTQAELARVARVMTMGALTASIAHEVNQPLSGIVTNASTCLRMLAADPPNVEGARETARRTIRDGNRASDVVTRLRALFVGEDPIREPLDLNEATREVVALLAGELERGGVVLRLDLLDDLPLLTGDRLQVQQVILNLVRNACEAMSAVHDRPRSLLITTIGDEDRFARLAVRDAGTGIDGDAMEKLFDTFFTTKSDGMGVGLSVSRSIVERHQGRLWVSANEGAGATFSFSIPFAPATPKDRNEVLS